MSRLYWAYVNKMNLRFGAVGRQVLVSSSCIWRLDFMTFCPAIQDLKIAIKQTANS